MKYRSFAAGLGLAAFVVLASPTLALAKEGLRASLTTPIPSTASPGDEITLAWILTDVDLSGHSQPFVADNVFVKLLSPTRDATIGFATGGDHARGEYVAKVKVPSGGIAGIQFGNPGRMPVRDNRKLRRQHPSSGERTCSSSCNRQGNVR